MTNHYGPNGEYAGNLYTTAMSVVRNADGSNVFSPEDYPNGIPVAAVRQNFAAHEHVIADNAFILPGEPDGVNPNGTVHYAEGERHSTGFLSWVRKSDLTEHARFGAGSAETRRQSLWLLDTYAAELVGGHDGMRITGAGHTRNGGRAYIQFRTNQILNPAGYDMTPFVTVFLGHDGSASVGAAGGMHVFSCANQLAGLIASAAKSKQTRNVTDAQMISRARAGLILEQHAEAAVQRVTQLAATRVTPEHWTAILDRIAPVTGDLSLHAVTRNTNTRETLTGMWNGDARCAEWNGSALGAFQTLNTFDLWERGTRGDTDKAERVTDELLSGALATRESDRLQLITSVLAAA